MLELISKFPFEPQDPQTRDLLDVLFDKRRWGQIAKIPGIRTIQSSRALPSNIDCDAYVFGLVGRATAEKLVQIDLLPQVDQINPGDIIHYFGPSKVGRHSQHLGIMVNDQIVRSKWNYGPVYEHPVWLVPTLFGNEVRIVRDRTNLPTL